MTLRWPFAALMLFFTSFFPSCSGSETFDCSTVLCLGSQPVYLELIENGENVLAPQDLNASAFELISQNGDNPELLVLQGLNDSTAALLELRSPIWAAGRFTYVLKYGNDYNIPLTLNFETSKGTCCGGMLRIQEITADGYNLISNPGGYYTLYLN